MPQNQNPQVIKAAFLGFRLCSNDFYIRRICLFGKSISLARLPQIKKSKKISYTEGAQRLLPE